MTELEKKLKALGVLDKFEANLAEASSTMQETLPEVLSLAELVKMMGEVSPEHAINGAFRWDETPEGLVFWYIVSELVEYDIEMLSPELLHRYLLC